MKVDIDCQLKRFSNQDCLILAYILRSSKLHALIKKASSRRGLLLHFEGLTFITFTNRGCLGCTLLEAGTAFPVSVTKDHEYMYEKPPDKLAGSRFN
ncbi:hypothetical protein AVEN_46135-1 [Araneus ventricosus]|uniref:Uncharacterized protein n=1 Tax=Araneus ventricosus TaxID=182803 RepID=A0A4Y2DAR4_ARAVE|nr:hypothetical protein AVEN_46135-1 [Araneus ventricosus]